jgi:non-ribosomal peptide synthetase component F
MLLDAAIERKMPMAVASDFWLDALYKCEIDRSLALPLDRYRVSDEHRTGRGKSVSFDFGKELSQAFLDYASMNHTAVEHLALACYFAFLFKLTNGEQDLCVGMNTHGRYKTELRTLIGMFVNAIPLRCQLDPHRSFAQLVEHVRVMAKDSLKYSYFPLQRILAQHHLASKPTFLDTSFEFRSTSTVNQHERSTLGDLPINIMPSSSKVGVDEIVSKFDFQLSIQLDTSNNQLACTIEASLDLFNTITVEKIAQRFLLVLHQLFETSVNQLNKPIYEVSLILPDEQSLVESINNTEIPIPPAVCLHHEFACRATDHPQKVAVVLDEQSLTYSELIYNVQRLSLYIVEKHHMKPREIICQCVERSLSMVNTSFYNKK